MRSALLALLALPTAAFAQRLDVHYEGHIQEHYAGPGRIGDAISGSFSIDPSLAPDNRAPDPKERNYIWNECGDPRYETCTRVPAPSDFVRDGSATTGESEDHVWLVDGDRGDSFGVENTERGAKDNVFARLEVYARGFLSSLGWHQSFEVRPTESGGTAWLTVNDVVGGVKRFWVATIDFVSVTATSGPSGSCKAP
jgi:hypothetical protein